MSGIRLSGGCKLAINWQKDNDVWICQHDVVKSFWRSRVSLVRFSCWSKFHINIIIGSGIMTIFVYKGLTRNPENGNAPALPNIWWLGYQVRYTKFGRIVSNKMLLNTAKCKRYSFHRFWVIKGKPTGGKIVASPPRLVLKIRLF